MIKKLTNDEINQKLAEYSKLSAEGKFALGDELAAQGEGAHKALWDAAENDELRRFALSTLSMTAKRFPPDEQKLEVLSKYLKLKDSKTRRHSAILLGYMGDKGVGALSEALGREPYTIVRSSILLALGSAGAKDALERYKPSTLEEERAQRTALDKCSSQPAHELPDTLDKLVLFELHSATAVQKQLAQKLRNMRYFPEALSSGRIRIETNDMSFIKLRALADYALTGGTAPFTPEACAAAASKLLPAVRIMHRDMDGIFRYRVQLNINVPSRAQWISDFSTKLAERDAGFINSPSNYEMQLIILPQKDGCRINLKLHTAKDERFTYRVKDVPAAINPSTAAAIMMLASGYLTPDAHVADPFCGSGTLLIERAMHSPYGALTGTDINADAVAAARANTAAAGLSARIVRGDARNQAFKRPADELFANMPFGNRVGNHAWNEKLYADFFENLPKMLKPGGMLFLYTMEQKLTRALIAKLKPIDEIALPSGGLSPVLFIART